MKYSKKEHGYGYDGIYNFIALKNDCIAQTDWIIGFYQGDAIACFIRRDGAVGLLDHAYGSCSGCDEYQSTDCDYDTTCEGLIEMADEYNAKVRWLTKDEQLKRAIELWLEGQAGFHIDEADYTKIYREEIPAFIKTYSK